MLVALALAGPGCGAAGDDPGTDTAAGGADVEGSGGLDGELTVAAAASLTEAFTALGEVFTETNPAATVTFTFDSSATLATQVEEGAPIDVFASADRSTMDDLVDGALIEGEPDVVAGNDMVIVTMPGNPEGITSLGDLVDVGTIALCGVDVPCGGYAAEVLEAAEVDVPESSVTRGQNVRATLTAVTEGDAVAAIVYATDAIAEGGAVEVVALPDPVRAIAEYPIGIVAGTDEAHLAAAFLTFVTGDEGQAILAEHGFLPAP